MFRKQIFQKCLSKLNDKSDIIDIFAKLSFGHARSFFLIIIKSSDKCLHVVHVLSGTTCIIGFLKEFWRIDRRRECATHSIWKQRNHEQGNNWTDILQERDSRSMLILRDQLFSKCYLWRVYTTWLSTISWWWTLQNSPYWKEMKQKNKRLCN